VQTRTSRRPPRFDALGLQRSDVRRVPEPELMSDPAQAEAYAEADFSEPHSRFVALLDERIGAQADRGYALDLGCGPADVTIRFARRFAHVHVDGIDASEPMLDLGRQAIAWAGLSDRVALYAGRLPEALLPRERYDGIFSNSLLHHVVHPSVLWDVVRRAAKPGAWVFVMDLTRPADKTEARRFVDLYAAGEPEILRRDFFRSLCAAYRPDEVREQLLGAELETLEVEVVSDRHLVVWGRV
jgi:SAM-dependent methyltransferase